MLKRILYAAAMARRWYSMPLSALAQTRLLRFLMFTATKSSSPTAAISWTASVYWWNCHSLDCASGQSRSLAKFSPDGKWIAFTGQYDGDEQVYVISAVGGEPKQLTFYPAKGAADTPRWGYDNQVYGWTNDGKSIVSNRSAIPWTLPGSPALHRASGRRASDSAADARSRLRRLFHRTARRWSTRLSRAISELRSDTAAGRQTSSTSLI